MFLSSLELDPRPTARGLQLWLANPYRIHQRISLAFDDPGRLLFRLERPARPRLLVLSPGEPDWARAFADFPRAFVRRHETKPFAPKVAEGQILRFLLHANPTVKREGRRHGLFREPEQLAWLGRKGATGGFVPLAVATRGGLVQVSRKGPRANLGPQRHFAVEFEGTLRVADLARFRDTLRNGIGSAKAYGFGLLSVAPA